MTDIFKAIETYLEKEEMLFSRDGNYIIIQRHECLVVITIVENYWFYIFTQGLLPKPVPASPEFAPLCFQILQLNDFTKLGRFFLNENNSLEFAMDCRIQEFNEDLFSEMLNILDYTLSEKLPEIIAPYYEALLEN